MKVIEGHVGQAGCAYVYYCGIVASLFQALPTTSRQIGLY